MRDDRSDFSKKQKKPREQTRPRRRRKTQVHIKILAFTSNISYLRNLLLPGGGA